MSGKDSKKTSMPSMPNYEPVSQDIVPITIKEEIKPLLRGQFHHVGFYTFVVVGLVSLWRMQTLDWPFIVYLASLLGVYGTSAAFHVIDWASKKHENLMQKLDHANIFLLIAGTYTPVCVTCLPFEEAWVKHILIAAWAIAVCGVLKCVLWQSPPKVLNVGFYFLCGLTILPFMHKIVFVIHPAVSSSFMVGGLFYLVGGAIYGVEYPDPYPDVFGYHEIFHVCTIIANLCFFVPILQATFRKYGL